MSKKPALPYDLRQECLWIVRGYDRRVKAYHEARRNVIDAASCQFVDLSPAEGERDGSRVYLPHGSGAGRPNESKYDQLQAIERWPETKKMRAVEQAKLQIGLDLENEEMRQRLTECVMLNCQSGKRYPYRYLNLPYISERDFYRRREEFLLEIADHLNILESWQRTRY